MFSYQERFENILHKNIRGKLLHMLTRFSFVSVMVICRVTSGELGYLLRLLRLVMSTTPYVYNKLIMPK